MQEPLARQWSGRMHQASGSGEEESWVDLSIYHNGGYDAGRGVLLRCLWYIVSLLIFESGWVPLSGPKAVLLRLFGARIGKRSIIKPNVRIKYPWRLHVGDHCWIGQEVWIDNLADVHLGDHVCLSQRAYLCTGSHDYSRRTFDLITSPISIGAGVWVGAAAIVLAGVRLGSNTVIAAGSLVKDDFPSSSVVAGTPARTVKHRSISPDVPNADVVDESDPRAA